MFATVQSPQATYRLPGGGPESHAELCHALSEMVSARKGFAQARAKLPDSCPLSGKLDDAIAPGDVTIKMYSEIASRILDIGTLLASSSDKISVLIPLKK
jgi:hypothetical protein